MPVWYQNYTLLKGKPRICPCQWWLQPTSDTYSQCAPAVQQAHWQVSVVPAAIRPMFGPQVTQRHLSPFSLSQALRHLNCTLQFFFVIWLIGTPNFFTDAGVDGCRGKLLGPLSCFKLEQGDDLKMDNLYEPLSAMKYRSSIMSTVQGANVCIIQTLSYPYPTWSFLFYQWTKLRNNWICGMVRGILSLWFVSQARWQNVHHTPCSPLSADKRSSSCIFRLLRHW